MKRYPAHGDTEATVQPEFGRNNGEIIGSSIMTLIMSNKPTLGLHVYRDCNLFEAMRILCS